MAADQPGYQLYQDLAEWWPLISPPEEYAGEARFAARVLRRAGGVPYELNDTPDPPFGRVAAGRELSSLHALI